MIFEGGNYKPQPTIFELLSINGINVPKELTYYPYFIFYDFETYLKPDIENKVDGQLQYTGSHNLLSISLMGNEEKESIFIPADESPEITIDKWIKEMDIIRKKYIKNMFEIYYPYVMSIAKLDNEKLKKLLGSKLVNWIESLPVYGFNSSAYDINVVKKTCLKS